METLQHCPSCGEHQWTAVTNRGLDFTTQWIHRCNRCGLMFQSPRMSEQALRAYYAADFSRRFRGGVTPDEAALAARDAIARYRFDVLTRLGVLAPGLSMLELGCGAGNFLRLCADVGVATWGVEPSEGYAEHARQLGLDVENGSFPDAHGGRERYDVIVLFHVLEHLLRPRETLLSIRELLEPGGRLIVEVPDLERALGLRWSEKYFHVPHVVDFTEASLEYLLNVAGFEIVARDVCGQSRARRHHVLVTAQIASSVLVADVDREQMRDLLRRLRFWIAVSRVTRPIVTGLRRIRPGVRPG